MTPCIKRFFSIKTASEKRLAVFLVLLGIGWCGLQAYQHWTPNLTVRSAHYQIASTTTQEEAETAAEKAEILFQAYREILGTALDIEEPREPLKMRLYRNRDEFKKSNVLVVGYAEAVYRNKCCHQYLDPTAANPWHWMIHEATHQLNHEVARLNLKLWLDEGLACYFSTSFIDDEGVLHPGKPDFNTYPIWWLPDVDLSGDWEADVAMKNVIPLRNLIRDNPIDRRNRFNTYYLHWWSWTHFLFHAEDGKFRDGLMELIAAGGSAKAFEKHIGPIEDLEQEWYRSYQQWADSVRPNAES
ncbi:MAG: hypothetical protein AAF585_01540 [Verrucomicrobiota bacterium]